MNKHRIRAFFVVIFMLCIIAAAILLPYYYLNGNVKTVKTNIPLIKTTLRSEADGADITVQTLFTVEMDSETRRKVSNQMLQEILTEIVEGMDVDVMRSSNSIDYINEYATKELNERLSEYTDSTVFVYDLVVGDRYQLHDPPGQASEVFDGLFGGG